MAQKRQKSWNVGDMRLLAPEGGVNIMAAGISEEKLLAPQSGFELCSRTQASTWKGPMET